MPNSNLNLELVDIHIHADDYTTNSNGVYGRHGETPDRIAQGVVANDLSGYVVLAHQSPTAEFFKVEEEVERLTLQTSKEIFGILGMESVFHFGAHKFHLGFLYNQNYSPLTLPATFDKHSDLKGVEQYRQNYPGSVILFHPGIVLANGMNYSHDTVVDLCNSGIIDGVEVLNGSTIHRGGSVCREMALSVLIKDRLALCGGSDAHCEHYIGKCVTGFNIADADTAVKDGAKDGAVKDSAVKDGAVKDGAVKDGAVKDGAKEFHRAIREHRTRAVACHPENVKDTVRQELFRHPASLSQLILVK